MSKFSILLTLKLLPNSAPEARANEQSNQPHANRIFAAIDLDGGGYRHSYAMARKVSFLSVLLPEPCAVHY
jgi:hypothetical protein